MLVNTKCCLLFMLWGTLAPHTLSVILRNRIIDLRSDTVTRPTAAMRTAIFEAEVGDDVFGDDPTVLKLEQSMATLFRKQSALFFPTGTMSNLAATMSWCSKRGSEMILGDSSHMFLYEQGGVAQIAGVSPRSLKNQPDGTIDQNLIEKAVRENNIHFPVTKVIALEDTHNFCGGRILPRGYLENVGDFAKSRDIAVHLDGARIWNAAAALQAPVHELVQGADSVSVCLSKGLGAPSGSILLGPVDFIERARRRRKVLGGGMRQVGVLAAAGLQGIADFEAGLLLPDHSKAKQLASAISEVPGFSVNLDAVETNIVLVKVDEEYPEPASIAAMLKTNNVLVLPFGDRSLRLVTHRDILDGDVEIVVAAFRDVSLETQTKSNAVEYASPAQISSTEVPAVEPNLVEVIMEEVNLADVVIEDSSPAMVDVVHIETVVKSEESRHLVEYALKNEAIFRPHLSAREIEVIVEGAEGLRVFPGDTVIREGDAAQFFYIIQSGKLERTSSESSNYPATETLTAGGHFGEIALIYDTPRSMSVVASEETVLWRIHKEHFFFVCKSADDDPAASTEPHVLHTDDIAEVVHTESSTQDELTTSISSIETTLVEKEVQTGLHPLVVQFPAQPVIIETGATMLIKTSSGDTKIEERISSLAANGINDREQKLVMKSQAWIPHEVVPSPEMSNMDGVQILQNSGGVEHYEEVVIHGMSLSDDGFCVLLKGTVCERILRVLVTPSDPMSDGLDRDQVDTSEAVTLLQLLQGIDVESVLARDALATKFVDSSPGRHQYVLQRVMIDTVDNSKNFHATLLGTSTSLSIPHGSSLVGDIAYPISVVPQHTFDHKVFVAASQPSSSAMSTSLTMLSEEPMMTDLGGSGLHPIALHGQAQEQRLRPIDVRSHKEVEIESAFEAIALALRHSAVVEVRSSLLQDESFSYLVEELPSYFPKLVKSDVPLDDRGRFGADYDARSEIERLQRRLQEAIRQGNSEKIHPIQGQLEFHSHLKGKPVLILPPPTVVLAPHIDIAATLNASPDQNGHISLMT